MADTREKYSGIPIRPKIAVTNPRDLDVGDRVQSSSFGAGKGGEGEILATDYSTEYGNFKVKLDDGTVIDETGNYLVKLDSAPEEKMVEPGSERSQADLLNVPGINWSRKAFYWEDVPKTSFKSLIQGAQKAILDLPEYKEKDIQSIGPLEPWQDSPMHAIIKGAPQYFRLEADGKFYLVNNEGYDYFRYITRVV